MKDSAPFLSAKFQSARQKKRHDETPVAGRPASCIRTIVSTADKYPSNSESSLIKEVHLQRPQIVVDGLWWTRSIMYTGLE
jgi:hypothetical protein